jgi:hypothetical protein
MLLARSLHGAALLSIKIQLIRFDPERSTVSLQHLKCEPLLNLPFLIRFYFLIWLDVAAFRETGLTRKLTAR